MTDLRSRFDRTVCDCDKCVAACMHMPGMLAPGDLQRLCPTGLSPEESDAWLREHFAASPGAVVWQQGELVRVPTIVPKIRDGGCVFLQDRRCTIHERAPFGCAFMDMHMNTAEADRRSRAVLIEIMKDSRRDGNYSRAWHRLQATGNTASEITERRANLAEAVHQIEKSHDQNG